MFAYGKNLLLPGLTGPALKDSTATIPAPDGGLKDIHDNPGSSRDRDDRPFVR